MIPFHHVAQKLYNCPLLVTPNVALTVSGVVLERVRAAHGDAAAGERGIEAMQVFEPIQKPDGSYEVHSPRASRFVGEYPKTEQGGKPAPYRITDGGVAIITIVGELVNRGAWVGASSGLVSYEGLKHQLATAAADSRVKSILLDMASPGGEAVGCFDAAAAVRRAATVKPVIGFVNGIACSGGYALLSACTRIITIREGITGSIGVVMLLLNMSAALKVAGIEPTLIFEGAHKVDGNPFESLSKDARSRFQADMRLFYDMFVDCVATGRPSLTPDAIRATEALTYTGDEALKIGLVDAVGTFEDLLVEMHAPNFAAVVIGDSAAKASSKQGADASKETNMNLWDHVKAALSATPAPQAGTTKADCNECGSPDCSCSNCSGPDCGCCDDCAEMDDNSADGNKAKALTGATPIKLTHYTAQQANRALAAPAACGAEWVGSGALEGGTETLADANCPKCLRAEIDRRDAAAATATKAVEEKAAADRAASIEAEADTFAAKCVNAGQEATAALRAEFVQAKAAGDEARVKRLETIAAGYVTPGPEQRLSTGAGPSAEDIASRNKSGATHFAALERLAVAGVTQSDPRFAVEYDKAVAALAGESHAAA